MKIYIDFENVNSGGLKGIESLKTDDVVMIYYSNNPNLNMETVQKMMKSKAKIEFQKLSDEIKNMNLKNALDIVILNDIARITGKNEVIAIISNDSGYDAMIQKFSKKGENIKRAGSISKISASKTSTPAKTSSKINEQAINGLFKNELSEFASDKRDILNVIKNSKTRCQINIGLAKFFYSEDVGIIMKAIKPYIKDLPGQ